MSSFNSLVLNEISCKINIAAISFDIRLSIIDDQKMTRMEGILLLAATLPFIG